MFVGKAKIFFIENQRKNGMKPKDWTYNCYTIYGFANGWFNAKKISLKKYADKLT